MISRTDSSPTRAGLWLLTIAAGLIGGPAPAVETGTLTLRVVDSESSLAIPARMHLRDSQGRPVVPKNVPHWADHFAIDGEIALELKAGDYTFELECGPEYKLRDGRFAVERGVEGAHELTMERFFDMHRQGWYAGDVLTYRSRNDLALWMRVEGLFAVLSAGPEAEVEAAKDVESEPAPEPLAVESFLRHGVGFSAPAEMAEFTGGRLIAWLDRGATRPDAPSASDSLGMEYLSNLSKKRGTFAAAVSPCEWDLPIWLARDGMDGVLVATPQMTREKLNGPGSAQRPPPKIRYPGTQGLGRYALDSYFSLLNAGSRVVPLGGSGSGTTDSPIGYCRTYVHCAPKFTPELWYANLRAGRVMVTNGPLMTPKVNGQLPGHTFKSPKGKPLVLRPEMNLGTREKIEYVELLKNGKVVDSVRLDQMAEAQGHLPEIQFEKSGWMAIRVITTNPANFHFALSGPFYVEIGGPSRPAAAATQAMIDWLDERPKRNKIASEAFHEAAREAQEYWLQRSRPPENE